MFKITFTPTNGAMNFLQDALSLVGEGALPTTAKAIQASLGLAQNTLSKYIIGETALDGIGKIKEPFSAQELKFERNKIGEFKHELNVTSEKLKTLIDGKPKEDDFDMKTKYPYGNKSRVSSKGTPYLIIPFRWGTPNKKNTKRRWTNFIPQIDYKLNVFPMKSSSKIRDILGRYTHPEKNFNGDMIERSNYKWGDRLSESNGIDNPDKNGDKWISKHTNLHYSTGMVRMEDEANGKSTYWSFRIITPFQPKDMWVRKGKSAIPPIDIESAWVKTIKDRVLEYLEAGLKDDFGL